MLARMDRQANHECGLHYVIYESRLLGMAMNFQRALPPNDSPAFIGVAAQRGYMLTMTEEERARGE